MARYPRDSQEADMWLRRIAKEFLRGRWLVKDLACASRSRKVTIRAALFSTGPIPENVFVRMVKGLQYLAEAESRQARFRS